MNPFLVVVDLEGATLGLDALTPGLPALSQSDGRVEVLWNGPWAGAWVPSRGLSRPAFIHQRGIFAIGNVRLSGRSNRRTDVDRIVDDLAFIIEEYQRQGPLAVRNLIGDFSFVLWDSHRRQVLAARDAFGVKTLYWQHQGSRLYLASHVDCFESTGYDRDFLGQFLIGLPSATTRTIYAGVNRLAPGTVLTTDENSVATRPYWSATEFVSVDRKVDPVEAGIEWRRLFGEAVTAQLDDGVPAWSQLSGGLDSSSIVAMATHLAREGKVAPLGGTVTVVDTLSDGNETRYSDAVLAAYPHHNAQLIDYWAWQPDRLGPRTSGEPRIFLPFFARSRAMNRAVMDGGGRVMLSGFGADQYLAGPNWFVADLVAQGRLGEAMRSLVDIAVSSRKSFYRIAFENVIKPLAPRWLRRRWHDAASQLAPWIDPRFAREFDLAERLAFPENDALDCGVFGKFQVAELGTLDLALERGISEEGIELRYPFLHRPLVEYTLSLPVTMRLRPNRRKWIVREALKDLLPPLVRDRFGKGGIDGRIIWSFTKERELLDRLLAGSRLAELGCIDRSALEQALAATRAGDIWSAGPLLATFALETWLAVKSGRWGRQLPAGTAENAAVNFSQQGVDHVELH